MNNTFGNNLRALRKNQKLTLEALGKILNISKSTLSDYEVGKTSPPIDICEKIAFYFGKKIDDLQKSDSVENLIKKTTEYADFSEEKDQLKLHNRLLNQQVEGLKIQLQLVKQLLTSRESEIRSLQTQIRLLDEKLVGHF